jgi:hypothetical protein
MKNPYPRKPREPKTTLAMATELLGRNNMSDGHNEAQATSASVIKWNGMGESPGVAMVER